MTAVEFKKICLSCKTWDKIPNIIFWANEEELYVDKNQSKLISLSHMIDLLDNWHFGTKATCNHCDGTGLLRFNEVKINGDLLEEHNRMKSSFTLLGLKDHSGQITLPPTGEKHTPNEVIIGLSIIKNKLEKDWLNKLGDSKQTGFFEFKIEFDRKTETNNLVRNHIDGFSFQEMIQLFEQIQNYFRKSLEQRRQQWTGQSDEDFPY